MADYLVGQDSSRTPDKMLSEEETRKVLGRDDVTYVWESKIDGSNVGISFDNENKISLQNRGHILGTGEHPQYSLLRSWAYTVYCRLHEALGSRYIMFGEWMYAVHTIKYRTLPHYFFEFDIWDRHEKCFYDTELRQMLLGDFVKQGILAQVPVVHIGRLSYEEALKLVNHAPLYGEDKPEGLYLKVEQGGDVIERYKLVRPDFVQTIIEGEDHWSHKAIEVQGLADGVDITNPKQ